MQKLNPLRDKFLSHARNPIESPKRRTNRQRVTMKYSGNLAALTIELAPIQRDFAD